MSSLTARVADIKVLIQLGRARRDDTFLELLKTTHKEHVEALEGGDTKTVFVVLQFAERRYTQFFESTEDWDDVRRYYTQKTDDATCRQVAFIDDDGRRHDTGQTIHELEQRKRIEVFDYTADPASFVLAAHIVNTADDGCEICFKREDARAVDDAAEVSENKRARTAAADDDDDDQ
jgi:hypothetical protein